MGMKTVNGSICYDSLVSDVRQLHEKVDLFTQKRKRIASDFKNLQSYLSEWHFTYDFPIICNEINEIIGKWDSNLSLGELQNSLKSYRKEIENLSNGITEVNQHQQKLLQLPERHGRKELTDKIARFLQNVQNIKIADFDKLQKDVLPKIRVKINEVYKAFGIEDGEVKGNQAKASALKKKIISYDDCVDKYNIKKVCAAGIKVVSGIISNPNNADPHADSHKLQQVEDALSQCERLFKNEEAAYHTLRNKMADNDYLLWSNDYDEIEDILNDGPRHNANTPDELETRYQNALKVKADDITLLKGQYKTKVLDKYRTDLHYITNHLVPKSELDDLRAKIERKIAEDKKKLYVLIAKIVGGIIAVGIIVWVLINFWQWILGIAVVLGILVYFASRD